MVERERERESVYIALNHADLTDDYNRHGGVVLLSFLEHCSLPSNIYVLYDKNLSNGKEKEEQENIQRYYEITSKYDCRIEFIHCDLPKWVDQLPFIKKYWKGGGKGSLMRLLLPEILPSIDKIIYLDYDIVVQTDIGKMWEFPIENYLIGACSDDLIFPSKSKIYQKKAEKRMLIPTGSYFNSGVLIMNLKKLRENEFTSKTLQFINTNQYIDAPDEAAANWFCQGKYLQLPRKYNVFSWRQDINEYLSDCIVHYCGKKPWDIYLDTNADKLYWDYLLRTPWCDDKRSIVEWVRQAPDVSKALPLLKSSFFTYTPGTRIDKVISALDLLYHIFVDFFKISLFVIRGGKN